MLTDMVAMCGQCQRRVPARHEIRDGKVFLVKDCPACGSNELMVSSDAAVWEGKRKTWGYEREEAATCNLHCGNCKVDHQPREVFVDVTNRCNMNCPICIANIQSMGFDFHPPLEYFEKVFDRLAKMDPSPFVEFYGGEPTVRSDLFDIVAMARERKLKIRVLTNGIRLADEEYCRQLCEARIPVRFAFDGRDPEIYWRLRKDRSSYEKKLKGLANLKKYARRKSSILSCFARGINDHLMGDLIDFCHENLDVLDQLALVPFREDWGDGNPGAGVPTTMEDAEEAIKNSVHEGRVNFIPAGLAHNLVRIRSFFDSQKRSDKLSFGGAHPNCESVTFLVSDGNRYRSIEHYLKMPLDRLGEEVVRRGKRIDPALSVLDPATFLGRWRGRMIVLKAFAPLLLWKSIDFRAIFKGSPLWGMLRIAAGAVRGKRFSDVLRRCTGMPGFLRVLIIPFEEYQAVESDRLANCKAAFAYEDVRDGKIKFIPACTWFVHRNDILKSISDKYGIDPSSVTRTKCSACPEIADAEVLANK